MPNSLSKPSSLEHNHLLSVGTSYYDWDLSCLASDLIREHELDDLDGGRLDLIVDAALTVKYLLFLAAPEEPSAIDLQSIAEDFIRRVLFADRSVQ